MTDKNDEELTFKSKEEFIEFLTKSKANKTEEIFTGWKQEHKLIYYAAVDFLLALNGEYNPDIPETKEAELTRVWCMQRAKSDICKYHSIFNINTK